MCSTCNAQHGTRKHHCNCGANNVWDKKFAQKRKYLHNFVPDTHERPTKTINTTKTNTTTADFADWLATDDSTVCLTNTDEPKDCLTTTDEPNDCLTTTDEPKDCLTTTDEPKDCLTTTDDSIDRLTTTDDSMDWLTTTDDSTELKMSISDDLIAGFKVNSHSYWSKNISSSTNLNFEQCWLDKSKKENDSSAEMNYLLDILGNPDELLNTI